VADELVRRGCDLYRDMARALHEGAGPVWQRVELSIAQLRALFTLADNGPMPIGGVASGLGIGLPAASSLVDRLVEQGLVLRREDRLDRRRTLAQTTESGAAMVQRLRQGSREALESWMGRMAPEDLEALVQGLEALLAVSSGSAAPETATPA
jgi:DNA-binding MarR family transcriptional regulator